MRNLTWYTARMAKVLPTPQQVRDLSLSGEFNAIGDPVIVDIRDGDVVPLYSAADVPDHTQWTRAVALHTAHILHIQIKLENANGDWGALAATTSRALQGVGSRGKAVGALNPGDIADDYLQIPTPYSMRLKRILKTFPVSVHTTTGPEI